MKQASRRKLLKTILAGSGTLAAGKTLPETWSHPVVESMLLPAHAQTSMENAPDNTSNNLPEGALPFCGECIVNWEKVFQVPVDFLPDSDNPFEIRVTRDGGEYACYQVAITGGTPNPPTRILSANNFNYGGRIEPGTYQILVRVNNWEDDTPNFDAAGGRFYECDVVCCGDQPDSNLAGSPSWHNVLRAANTNFIPIASFEITENCEFIPC
jgi:hypothetical protein